MLNKQQLHERRLWEQLTIVFVARTVGLLDASDGSAEAYDVLFATVDESGWIDETLANSPFLSEEALRGVFQVFAEESAPPFALVNILRMITPHWHTSIEDALELAQLPRDAFERMSAFMDRLDGASQP